MHFACNRCKKLLYFRLLVACGEMAERLMALVLKTSDAERHRGFESLSLRRIGTNPNPKPIFVGEAFGFVIYFG